MRIAMNKPELYNASNELQKQSTIHCLNEYATHINWNKVGDTAIDIGCGDGSVSVIVKNFAPHGFKKFVASDVNENMITFASQHYADKNISFRVLDIEGDIPEDLIETFNHVFSFYALHWVKKQEKAFKNIYNLLSDDGDIFLTFLGNTAIYSVYQALAGVPKWKTWLKDTDIFLSPYHNKKNADKTIAEIAKKCGFKNVKVRNEPCTSDHDSVSHLRGLVQSVEPFSMPQEVFDEFIKDFYRVGQEIGVLNFKPNGGVKYDYTLLIVSANK